MTTTFRHQFGATLALTFAIAFGRMRGGDVGRRFRDEPWLDVRQPGGEALFAHVCAACHQADARGAIGAGAYPALAADAKSRLKGLCAGASARRAGAMPPVGRMMSDAQIADVINYVRGHFGNAYADAISPSEVAAARAAAKAEP